MSYLRRAVFVFLVFMPILAFGQADQAIISAIDAPDPIVPGNTLTYTITAQNNGPNPAVNGGLNLLFDANFTPTSVLPPAGFSCTALAQIMSCTNPSWAPGGPVQFIASGTVAAHLNNFPDGTLTSSFSTSGVTPDPVPGNNSSGNIVTSYNSPQVDLSILVTDSPDPVFPDGNITYTVDLTNAGPDNASSVNFNVFNNGSLKFQSVTIPSGWSCPAPPAVGGTPTFTCSRATWAPGTSQFLVVVRADPAVLGINDGTVMTAFSVFAGASDETDDSTDNSETESTQYVTPDADVAIAVTDSPDPVVPDGNITYTVTVSNNGPDTAPNITLSSFGGNNLRFVSGTVPAGWNCTLPPAGTQTTSYSCTHAGLSSGASSVLTFVMQADDALLGINDQTILFGYSANSSIADPVAGNNSETESTAYSTADADLSITASDSPDPVAPDGDITYTVTLNNAGPDSAAATLNVPMNNTLKFTSITIPAGFGCTGTPSAGGSASFSCTDPTFTSGETAVFTIVLNADFDAFGNFDQTINQFFGVTGNISDPDNLDNGITVSTSYDVPNANLGITASDAPDPVAAGSNITYTGTVTNAGPDTATTVTVTMNLAPGLLFVSLVGPAGFTCGTPSAGVNGPISCTIASLPNGANLPFTLIAQVNPALNNGPDGVIQQVFSIGSATNDPVNTNNSLQVDTAYTTPDADISVTNSAAPNPVAPGGTITFTQSITNNGPDTAVNATFTQTVPAGTTFQSFTPAAGWTCGTPAVGATGAITCSKATMLSGETGAFTLIVNVTAPSGSIGSQVTGDSDTYDPDPADNTAGAGTTVIAPINADLAITKSTLSTTAPAGSTITYTLSITNNGPDTAENVTVTDTLPASLLFQSITATGWTCTTPAVGATGTITCTRATLPVGSSTITLNTTVASNASGTVSNVASIFHTGADANSANENSTTPPAPIVPAEANLGIVKTTATTSVAVGTVFSYTITVTNAGPSPATNVVVNDTLPAQLELVSATPSQGTCNAVSPIVCNLGGIVNGANATIALQVRAIAPAAAVVNSATVVGAETDPASGNNSDDAPSIIVTGGPAEEQDIPTLSEWMLLALMGMLGMVAVFRMRT